MKNWVQDNWLKVVAIVFVLGALGSIPYNAYYQLMNWVVVGASVVTALQAYKRGNQRVAWLFVFVAVLFNPLAPIYLRADLWQLADLIVAVLFATSFYFLPTNK